MKHIKNTEISALIMEHRHYFYRIAFSYVKNEQDALDIVSEATYNALSHYKDLREPKYFKTWMTRILINIALDHLKKVSKQVVYDPQMLEISDITPYDSEITFDLYSALDFLEANDKAFIVLKYFEEYTFKDISELFGIPESTVKTKIYRCLKLMKNYMQGGAHI